MINFRDLADISVKLRKGMLYRSAGPLFAGSDPALSKVQTWIDLRTEDEWESCPLPQFPRRIPVPMDLADQEFRNVSRPAPQDWSGMYLRGFERNLSSFSEILVTVVTEPKPILFSCAVGRDRTGVTAALLLHLLGVDREAIVRDYCRTSEAARDLAKDYFAVFGRKGLSEEEILDSYFVCVAEVVDGLLNHFSKHELRILTELERHGFDGAKIGELRRIFLY
jgi:rhodanese-related sulfurtransferase